MRRGLVGLADVLRLRLRPLALDRCAAHDPRQHLPAAGVRLDNVIPLADFSVGTALEDRIRDKHQKLSSGSIPNRFISAIISGYANHNERT